MTLTPRQRDVVEGVVDGETYAEIGERLGITARTVRMHVERIAKKHRQTSQPLRWVRRHAREILAA